MRFLTVLLLLAAFLFNAPGIHAADIGNCDVQTVGAEASPPVGKTHVDFHHGCSHIHVADRARAAHVAQPVVWEQTRYVMDAALVPASADPSMPDEPPRA